MKQSFLQALAGLGVCAVLAGCGSSGSDESSKATSTTTVAPEAPPTPAAEKTGSSPHVLASSDTTVGGAALHLDVNALKRSGELMTLTMTVKNNGTGNVALFSLMHVYDYDYKGGFFGVYLVDSVNKKKYLPAMDSEKMCLCTKLGGFPTLKPQDSATLTATFGAAPADVKVLDVSVPTFPPITAVPVN